MRCLLTLLLAGVLSASATWAQAQELEPAFEQAMEARSAARVAKDGEGWGRYTTDDFVVIGATGDILSKSQRIAAINRGENTDPNNAPREENVRRHGDTVVVTATSATDHITNVWVKENNRWLVAHVQFTRIE